MISTQTTSFLFLELPREIQRKVLEHYYDTPFEIYADDHRDDRDRRFLKFTTNLEADPLLVSRTFRHDALSILYATTNNSLFWSASRTRIDELLISNHFLHLCATVSELELWDRYALHNLRCFRTRLPNLLLINLRPFEGKGSEHSARSVIESASSVLPVLQGALNEKFRNAAIDDMKSWLSSESTWMPYTNPKDLEGLAFGLTFHFEAADIWPADEEEFGFPGSLLTFHVEVNPHYCHIRKKCFTRLVDNPALQQGPVPWRPAILRPDQEEKFRQAKSVFPGIEVDTTEEKYGSLVVDGGMSPLSFEPE